MHQLSQYRIDHGDCFLTVLPDGTEIAWAPLSIEQFIEYDNLFLSSRYTREVIEDEIFRKCVKDRFFTLSLDEQKAGTIRTVVENILAHSGPQNPDHYNKTLAQARRIIQDPLHLSVEIISRAFPAYKLEDIYAMDYGTLMLRLAMAEDRLLRLKLIDQPIILEAAKETQTVQTAQQTAKIAALKKKLADLTSTPALPTRTKTVASPGQTVIKTQDESPSLIGLSGHELQDYDVEKRKALDGLEFIYPEYFKMMKEGKKLTPDDLTKSDEQRKAEYYKQIEDIKAGRINPAQAVKDPPRPTRPKKKQIKRR